MKEWTYRGKPVITSDHANIRMWQRRVPAKVLAKGLEKGVKIPDKEPNRMLCIYKAGEGEYYTMVVEEQEDRFSIVTAYVSSEWEKKTYERLKTHGTKTT